MTSKNLDVEITDNSQSVSSDLVNNSTVSANSITLGKAIVMTGAATGGSGSYTYAFYYKKSTASTYSVSGTEFGSDTARGLTPKATGVYDIKITVKDSVVTDVTELPSEDVPFAPQSIGVPGEKTVTNFLNTLLLPKLSNDTQLVIIQLGDNTSTALAREKFKTSCATLIEFIFAHAPNARIAWAGTWYENDTVNEVITNTCKQYSVTRIPLNDLSIVDGNMSHIGATYIDGQGNEQTITTAGVASHPSPQGMRAIADRIISTLLE